MWGLHPWLVNHQIFLEVLVRFPDPQVCIFLCKLDVSPVYQDGKKQSCQHITIADFQEVFKEDGKATIGTKPDTRCPHPATRLSACSACKRRDSDLMISVSCASILSISFVGRSPYAS